MIAEGGEKHEKAFNTKSFDEGGFLLGWAEEGD